MEILLYFDRRLNKEAACKQGPLCVISPFFILALLVVVAPVTYGHIAEQAAVTALSALGLDRGVAYAEFLTHNLLDLLPHAFYLAD